MEHLLDIAIKVRNDAAHLVRQIQRSGSPPGVKKEHVAALVRKQDHLERHLRYVVEQECLARARQDGKDGGMAHPQQRLDQLEHLLEIVALITSDVSDMALYFERCESSPGIKMEYITASFRKLDHLGRHLRWVIEQECLARARQDGCAEVAEADAASIEGPNHRERLLEIAVRLQEGAGKLGNYDEKVEAFTGIQESYIAALEQTADNLEKDVCWVLELESLARARQDE